MNHEEQHQELLLTDILHAFFTNPLRPAYRDDGHGLKLGMRLADAERGMLHEFDGRVARGRDMAARGSALTTSCRGTGSGWSRFELGKRLVTCGEFAAFMADGGYKRPELWLSAGWDAVKANGWHAPLYWNERRTASWSVFTLRGRACLWRSWRMRR